MRPAPSRAQVVGVQPLHMRTVNITPPTSIVRRVIGTRLDNHQHTLGQTTMDMEVEPQSMERNVYP